MIEQMRNQKKKVKLIHEIYEDEVSTFRAMTSALESRVSKALELVFDENIPVNVYSNYDDFWFEFDVLGLELTRSQINKIEEITETYMKKEYMFYW